MAPSLSLILKTGKSEQLAKSKSSRWFRGVAVTLSGRTLKSACRSSGVQKARACLGYEEDLLQPCAGSWPGKALGRARAIRALKTAHVLGRIAGLIASRMSRCQSSVRNLSHFAAASPNYGHDLRKNYFQPVCRTVGFFRDCIAVHMKCFRGSYCDIVRHMRRPSCAHYVM